MTISVARLSTGLQGLDRALKGLIAGDNIVWQVNDIDDYLAVVEPFVSNALSQGHHLTYFRFARHRPLVDASSGAVIHELQPSAGFEPFLTEIHKTIEADGRGAFFVFDCLSDLAVDWSSDQMLGNFFMLTCPYLYDLETITYFALVRNHHSFHATAPILETTQIFSDVYRHQGRLYIHPLKVQQRYSPTLHTLHVWEGADFRPVTDSITISEILTSVPWTGLESTRYHLSIWNRAFLEAEQAVHASIAVVPEEGGETARRKHNIYDRVLRMVVSRDDRVLELVRQYLSLEDIIRIRNRMIGTGLIGGKTVGMILARAILRAADPRWKDLLEIHDSFFIGSDVFYTYLVRNGCWWVRQKQKDPRTFLEGAESARQGILRGTFPDYIEKQFIDMLDYYGQSPIIVRSSSLLEDNFGNAFAGKYESVFCPNQGPRAARLRDFISAMRAIYASTMSEKALTYRASRGMLDRDEQMAILVQRVSGARHGNLFYPHIAGVGFSFNPYVWNERIDPKAGVLRLVFGLGTRAVDRSDDDYTRVVALNEPQLRPEDSFDKVRRFTQRRVDLLDFEANIKTDYDFEEALQHSPDVQANLFASPDEEAVRTARERTHNNPTSWVLTFDRLFSHTNFIADMRQMMRILHQAYDYPVDVEFTANFRGEQDYRINLVQCRPLQVIEGEMAREAPEQIEREDLILESRGPIIGHSRVQTVGRMIYVVPSVYSALPVPDRHAVARLVGKLTRLPEQPEKGEIILIGPGRWGTTTPQLGVPVSFAEISHVAVICEIVAMRKDLVPDVSLGTHFFSDLVEMDILYLALYPDRENNFLNERFILDRPNQLEALLPSEARWANAVRVIDLNGGTGGASVILNANTLKQRVVSYLER
ncbi:MAG: pyruvate, phosphate dikinase [Candidatus Sumerlaeota bacterium]|nr:pyruvate, phosphate dikinase [Candidatus Sumerlaeota bacterium]